MTYIISQVFVVLTYILLAATYFTSHRTKILVLSLFALFCNGVHYSLLSAWTGLGVVIIATIRNVLFLIQQKIKVLDKYVIDDWIILITLLIISGVTAVMTYDSFFSLFSIAGSILYTISVWQKNIKVYRILGIISSAMSLIYFIYIASIFAIILESIMLVTRKLKKKLWQTKGRCFYGVYLFTDFCRFKLCAFGCNVFC